MDDGICLDGHFDGSAHAYGGAGGRLYFHKTGHSRIRRAFSRVSVNELRSRSRLKAHEIQTGPDRSCVLSA